MPVRYINSFYILLIFTTLSSCSLDGSKNNDDCDSNVFHKAINAKINIVVQVKTTEGLPVYSEPVKVVVEKYPCDVDYATATESYMGYTDDEGNLYQACNTLEIRNKYDDIIITATLTDRDISREEKTWFPEFWDGTPKVANVRITVPAE